MAGGLSPGRAPDRTKHRHRFIDWGKVKSWEWGDPRWNVFKVCPLRGRRV